MKRWLLRLVSLLVVLALVGAGAALLGYRDFVDAGPLAEPKTVVLPRGAGVEGVALALESAGVIRHHQVFVAGVALLGTRRPLKAGEYAFPAAVSAADVMRLLQEGRTVVRRLTVAEGLTTAQVLALIAGAEALDGALPTPPPGEGELLPETYNYSWGDPRAGMVQRLRRAMSELLAETWRQRAPDLPLASAREALILASIVEKETGVEAERPRVAAVFLNRLKRGMRLQSDPTVIYALTEGAKPLGRELTRADLDRPSPYNTYVSLGLPPGPIANPGRASLLAVMHPATTDALYFVADGTGGHVFAATLEEHNRNVARWRRVQRDKAAE
ncbi:MAG: endolytic transglycosylase MltG [Alphaproteobacteria bacterium]|nr:endolytic transglycosylase MltG [Alphaproteobacteria bacterium]